MKPHAIVKNDENWQKWIEYTLYKINNVVTATT